MRQKSFFKNGLNIPVNKEKSSDYGSDTSIECSDFLLHLFSSVDLAFWLNGLVCLWNQHQNTLIEKYAFFSQWNIKQQQLALDFFSAPQCIHLINAIFFYKIHPDQLFNETSLHPEKLVSVCVRLELLHHYIEHLQQQLRQTVLQQGLSLGADYLFHGEELPSGINLIVSEQHKNLIQEAMKQLQIVNIPQDEELSWIPPVQNLLLVYQYRFNPHRLIDMVMVLKQAIQSKQSSPFYQAMIDLFHQVSTCDCVDLYGYFSNNDTQYLLNILYQAIHSPQELEWLPPLHAREKGVVQEVIDTLKDVMEALRSELNNRAILSEPYQYRIEADSFETLNREALFRLLSVYNIGRAIPSNPNLEQLFMDIENAIT